MASRGGSADILLPLKTARWVGTPGMNRRDGDWAARAGALMALRRRTRRIRMRMAGTTNHSDDHAGCYQSSGKCMPVTIQDEPRS